MSLLHQIHSTLRWIILAVGLLGIITSYRQLSSPSKKASADRIAPVFLAVLDVQWLLGLALAVLTGAMPASVVLHGAIMTLVVVLAHALKRQAHAVEVPGRLLIYRFLAPVLVILAGHLLLVSGR